MDENSADLTNKIPYYLVVSYKDQMAMTDHWIVNERKSTNL